MWVKVCDRIVGGFRYTCVYAYMCMSVYVCVYVYLYVYLYVYAYMSMYVLCDCLSACLFLAGYCFPITNLLSHLVLSRHRA